MRRRTEISKIKELNVKKSVSLTNLGLFSSSSIRSSIPSTRLATTFVAPIVSICEKHSILDVGDVSSPAAPPANFVIFGHTPFVPVNIQFLDVLRLLLFVHLVIG